MNEPAMLPLMQDKPALAQKLVMTLPTNPKKRRLDAVSGDQNS